MSGKYTALVFVAIMTTLSFTSRVLRHLLCVLAVSFVCGEVLALSSDGRIRSAFLSKIIRLTKFPPSSSSSLTLCVRLRKSDFDSFAQLAGLKFAGRALKVVNRTDQEESCDIEYNELTVEDKRKELVVVSRPLNCNGLADVGLYFENGSYKFDIDVMQAKKKGVGFELSLLKRANKVCRGE